MNIYPRENYRYTAGFCEENIWWLVRSMSDQGVPCEHMQVLFLSNPDKSILVMNQLANEMGQPMLWDYHVILQAELEAQSWIFDFDTRLDFPEILQRYMSKTFPPQSLIPGQFQSWVRTIPAGFYLKHFYSDRSHMQGKVAQDKFPDYQIIQPGEEGDRIALADFWDMQKEIAGCNVRPLKYD